MGRGINNSLGTIRRAKTPYEAFMREHLHVHYLTSDEAVANALETIRTAAPNEIGLDFETSSKDGLWGANHGSLSLIQIEVAGHQWLIDCQEADPGAIVPLLEDLSIIKDIQYMNFELEWSKLHLGARSISPVYDTCIAWQVIQRTLREMHPEAAQDFLPGWERHNNKLDTLVARYLGFQIPKSYQSSDWGIRPLTPEQVLYAATDVAVLPPLVQKTRRIAERIGLTEAIDKRIRWVKRSIHERIENPEVFAANDDYARILGALERASTKGELDKLLHAARRMTLTSIHFQALIAAYSKRSEQLENQG